MAYVLFVVAVGDPGFGELVGLGGRLSRGAKGLGLLLGICRGPDKELEA